jgi:23S rRNA A1618 N6-methylase RlmF
MTKTNYWEECLDSSFCEHGITVTPEQLKAVAEDVQGGHENYGMAFYSPPVGDRIADIKREWKKKYDDLQREFDEYRGNAETAVKQALKQYSDANISIGEYGEVFRYDGCTTQIQ